MGEKGLEFAAETIVYFSKMANLPSCIWTEANMREAFSNQIRWTEGCYIAEEQGLFTWRLEFEPSTLNQINHAVIDNLFRVLV